jgi:cell division GTPase FtsZ
LKERGQNQTVDNAQIRLVNQIISVLENPMSIELDSKEVRQTVSQLSQSKLRATSTEVGTNTQTP